MPIATQTLKHNKAETSSSAAYTDLGELIGLRHSAADIQLSAQRQALSLLAGPNRTHFRGRGIDFEEVRLYQAGDDIRCIDWRVTARSGKPHTKLFREERERPTLLIVDQRSSMFFGSRCCFKSVLAARLAALIAWSALGHSDRVGGLVFNDQQHSEIRPKRSRNTVLQLLNMIDGFNHQLSKESIKGQAQQNLSDIAADMLRIVRPGSSVFIISDLHGFNEETEKLLYHLARHNDVSCLLTYDALESELPAPGYYTFSNGSQRFSLHTGAASLRESYQQRFAQRYSDLQDKLGRAGIALIPAATHEEPLQLLQQYFGLSRRR